MVLLFPTTVSACFNLLQFWGVEMLQTVYLRTEWKCRALQLIHSTEGMSQQAYKLQDIRN